MKQIQVVAAIIHEEGRVLATQRGYGEYEGWWGASENPLSLSQNVVSSQRNNVLPIIMNTENKIILYQDDNEITRRPSALPTRMCGSHRISWRRFMIRRKRTSLCTSATSIKTVSWTKIELIRNSY